MALPQSLQLKLNDVAAKIREIARRFEILCGRRDPGCSEASFMFEVERLLEREVWSALEVPAPRYEYRVYAGEGFVGRHYGRVDAYYGLVFFEYKLPRPGLGAPGIRDDAIDKARSKYIPGLLSDENVKAVIERMRQQGLRPLVTGVIWDGIRVVFVEHDVDAGRLRVEPEAGVYELDGEVLRQIVLRVLASCRKRLDARLLAADFGHGSEVARRAVPALYRALREALERGGRARMLYEEWRRLASAAYPIDPARLAGLARDYGIEEGGVDGAALFFAVQTYYALVLKLIAAEVASRFYDSAMEAFIESLRRGAGDAEALRRQLEEFERGGPAGWYGILNLLEGQLFSWYLDAWGREVYEAVRAVIERLGEYDVEPLVLSPRLARDVFKQLYEELVPREEVRRYMGIYTTPDWLAELVLDELGLTVEGMLEMRRQGRDPLDIKVLDPGAGTGTFLMLYIQRLAEYLRRVHNGRVPPEAAREALRKITRNVVGFDIDALALMTARANYLIALASAGLLQHKGGGTIEIPVYMANSVAPAELMTGKAFTKGGEVEVVRIPTSVCDCGERTKCCLMLPARLVAGGLAGDVLSEMLDGLRRGLDRARLERILRERFGLNDAEVEVLGELYERLLELKRRGADDVWIPVIKSYVLPALYRKSFDYVVGNPPWLPLNRIADPGYQDVIKNIIKDVYGLTEEGHLVTQMEMAALFLARAVEYYAKDGGRVGFVMPRSIFNANQHHNLRTGAARARVAFRKIIDCENVQPLFYVPAVAVIAERGTTSWPVEAVVVSGRLPEDRHKVMPLDEARKHLKVERRMLFLNRVGSRSFLDYRELRIKARRSDYYGDFFNGATAYPRGLWFVKIVDASSPDFVTVETNRARVEERGHVSVSIGPLPVEREFIYGVLTSAEVVPFCHLPPNLAVLPIMPGSGGYRIVRKNGALARGKAHLARYLEEAEKGWSRGKSSQK
ncbi:MAG: hypothetical protein LM577_08385, partial [Thermoproteaceae archaeon]|nr:hypothetical protein [Thermoproteaceae archaeon]